MKTKIRLLCFLVIVLMISSFVPYELLKTNSSYPVKRLKKPMKIDGNWNKPQWKSANLISISNYMGEIPKFQPTVKAKMMYDDDNLYLIFKVKDYFVHTVVEEYNGPVSTDACVEFFFSPDTSLPDRYFNLEINAGGTPLMAYHIYEQKEYQNVSEEDLKKIEIAHSLPKKIEEEITGPVIWTVEYKLPLSILRKFCSFAPLKKGSAWRANFYNTASKGSNPRYITWSVVNNPEPNFHLPQYFGELNFGK